MVLFLTGFLCSTVQPPPPPNGSNGSGGAVSGDFINSVTRLSEDEAIAQGYTLIKTADDLNNIRNNLSGKYILMNDIDLSSYANWDPIGDFASNTGFTGTLDGNGYVVKNLTINRPTEDGVGLFALIGDANTMSGGEVINLGLENVDIEGNMATGGLAGTSAGNITNCYIQGNIKGNGGYTGGLVGYLVNGSVYKSSSTANITGNGTYTGGLIGMNASGKILNSYATGFVVGNAEGTGGLVGNNYGGTISYSYATGLIQGTTEVGGLVGQNMAGAKLENSIWDTQTTGQNAAYGFDDGLSTFNNNNGLTTSQMKDPTNWTGWDDTIWDFSSYPPKLKGQSNSQSDDNSQNAIRLQIGEDEKSTSCIYLETYFSLDGFSVDFSTSESCAGAIDDIDELLSKINEKRAEFGAAINRLNSILESQTTTIQNYTAAKSTIMDADIATESADFVKSQILQQTSSALLAQSQNIHSSIVLSLIQ